MTGRQKKIVGAVLLAFVAAAAVIFVWLGDDDELSVQQALADTRSHGFDAVIWRASPAMRQQAKEIAQRRGTDVVRISGDGQVILLRGRQITDLKQPLVIVWFPSSDGAASRVEADRALFEGHLTEDEQAGLPRDFEVRRLTEKRVCNLVVTSYDDGSYRGLSARVSRLVETLQRRCS
jgi:hypothetical protein